MLLTEIDRRRFLVGGICGLASRDSPRSKQELIRMFLSRTGNACILDVKKLTLNSGALRLLAECVLDVTGGWHADAIGALRGRMSSGAETLLGATLAASQRDMDGFFTRVDQSLHVAPPFEAGRFNGEKRGRLVLLDGITSRADRLWSPIARIESVLRGSSVIGLISVFDWERGCAEDLTTAGLHFHAILRASELGVVDRLRRAH